MNTELVKANKKPEIYSEITNEMIYQLLDDKTLKSVRDKLDFTQVTFLSICERACVDEIGRSAVFGVGRQDAYQAAKKRVIDIIEGLSASHITNRNPVAKLAWDNDEDLK
jgi:hypothetical protein